MIRPRDLSIRQRLLLVSLLPAALIAALVSLYFVVNASHELDRSVEDRGLAIVGFLAPASEYGVISGNRDSLSALLQATLNQRQVHAAAIIDQQGRTLAISGATHPPALEQLAGLRFAAAIGESAEVLRFAAPVTRTPVELGDLLDAPAPGGAAADAEILGWVYAEIDTGPLHERKRALLLIDLALVSLSLAAVAWLAVRMANAVSEPVSALARAVGEMRRGDPQTRVDEASGGELGALERGFNQMASALEGAQREMQRRIDEATAQLRHQADHDALTGLPNRRAFERVARELLSSGRRREDAHALCFIDLDRFKIVNDTCGHQAGDELLCRIGALLRSRLREQDTVARVGGDEFALLLRNSPPDNARRVAENLRCAVEGFRFVWQERRFAVGASIGLVNLGGPSIDLGRALAAADHACYQAKRAGRNLVVEVSADSEPASAEGADQPDSLTAALEASRLHLHAHPIRLAATPSQAWAEVALRLDACSAGSARPLLERCERSGEGLALDTWVLHAACQLLCSHGPAGGDGAHLSFNVGSNSLLAAGDYLLEIERALERTGLTAARLAFEVSADLAAQYPGETAALGERLHAIGCRLVLDRICDHAPALLRDLRPDYVKIRGDLLARAYGPRAACAVADGIASIAAELGIAVILGAATSPGAWPAADGLQGDAASPARPLAEWLRALAEAGSAREESGATSA